ncbi:MAG: NAD-dependent epimerase/dehydratase family protein, partial [bacterium]
CIRDYIHIDDLVRAHLLALDFLISGHASDIFNLGTNSGFSNLDIIAAARQVTGHPIPLEFGPRRAGDPDQLVASNQKAGAILGWKPTLGILDIIGSAWAYHSRHPEGYRR